VQIFLRAAIPKSFNPLAGNQAGFPSPGNVASTLDTEFKAGLLLWAVDEISRGVNPQRCLGVAVLGYELTTLL
jgi:hypothetical protein